MGHAKYDAIHFSITTKVRYNIILTTISTPYVGEASEDCGYIFTSFEQLWITPCHAVEAARKSILQTHACYGSAVWLTKAAGLTFYFKCVLTTIRNVSGSRYL